MKNKIYQVVIKGIKFFLNLFGLSYKEQTIIMLELYSWSASGSASGDSTVIWETPGYGGPVVLHHFTQETWVSMAFGINRGPGILTTIDIKGQLC